jgi:tetratricopeptide (TPR) repeat protein
MRGSYKAPKSGTSLQIGNIFLLSCFLSLYVEVAGAQSQARLAAADALRKGDYEQAVHLSDDNLRVNPGDCRVLTVHGLALQGLNKQSEAVRSFKKAVNICPTFLPALEALAQSEYSLHDPDAAETLEKVVAIVPNEPTANAMLGAISYAKGDCAQAVVYYSRADAVVEAEETASREFGTCLLTAGESGRAEEVLGAVLKKNESVPNRLAFAYAAWKNKDYSNALGSLQSLLSKASENPRAVTMAAQICEEMGDTPHATEWAREAILADPRNAENYLFFATLSFTHASYKVGVDVVNLGLRQLPDDARLYLARGVLLVQTGELELAIADFRRARELDPKMSSVADAMALLQSQKHDAPAALAILRQAVIQHPDDPLVQYLYAEGLSEEGGDNSKENLVQAIAAAEESLKLDPDYQPARDLLCRLYLDADKPNEVVRQAEAALQRNQDDDVALYQGMVAYRRLGQRNKADSFVVRLKEVRSRQQSGKMRYLLTESTHSQP